MGKFSLGKALMECVCLATSGNGSNSCFCMNYMEEYSEDESFEDKPLVASEKQGQGTRLKDFVSGNQTLAFQLKPKMVVMKVSIHCNGCARKVEKHISKLDGVTSYKVALESKTVVVIGDIIPFEVVESVSKVKRVEIWNSQSLTN